MKPNSCSKCEWCTLNHKDNYGRPFCLMARMPLYNGDRVNEGRGQHKDSLSDFECPLHLLKTHDRELVKEVCEKIRKNYSKFDSYDDFDWFGFENFLDQLQKEFEK